MNYEDFVRSKTHSTGDGRVDVMTKLDGRKCAFIGGIEVVTTSEVSRMIGLTLSVQQIKDFTNISPLAVINAATYWKTSDVPVIAALIGSHICTYAANLQLILNIEDKK